MNIIDFIKINGDKTFDELAFGEIDALIISQLAYLQYSRICTSFNDVIDSKNLNAYETSILLSKNDHGHIKENERLMREFLSSKRYYGVKIGHYINEHNVNEVMQFSAVTFIFDNFICISYMGTDATLLGWKEDFAMSYQNEVSSQIKGMKYFETIANQYDLPIYLMGHSKGGNVAIYSLCKSKLRNRIIDVYSFDAPGFKKEFAENEEFISNSDHMNIYVPESSFIGLIMYNDMNYKIVASNRVFLFQHNMYNWQVDNDKLVLKDKLTKKSLAFSESNKKWLDNFSDEERKFFFDTIFELSRYNENRSFIEIKANWRKELSRIVKEAKGLNEEDKQLISKIFKNLFSSYMKFLISRPNN